MHGALGVAHLINEGGVCIQDGGGSNIAPDIVGGDLHHHNVGLRNCEPSWKLVICNDTSGKEASVTVVLAVILDTTALAGQSADKINVRDASLD